MPTSTDQNELRSKLIEILLLVVLAGLGWYLNRLTDRIDALTNAVLNLQVQKEYEAQEDE